MISIVVACDKNNLIGKDNELPWHISEDLKLFKQRTIGGIVIMGKNTWRSLPKLYLDGRINIVITKDCEKLFYETFHKRHFLYGPIFEKNIDNALIQAKAFSKNDNNILDPDRETFIIGGELVYKTVLQEPYINRIDRIYMTRIKGDYIGNKYFPELNMEIWEEKKVENYEKFDIITYVRKH